MTSEHGNHINRELAEQVEREIAELDAKLSASAERRPNERPTKRWFREMFWLMREYRKAGRELRDFERKLRTEDPSDTRWMYWHPAFTRLSRYIK